MKLRSLLSLFLLAGCTHIHVAGFDLTRGTVTVAGSRYASQGGLSQEAANYCKPRQAVLLSCGEGSRQTIHGDWGSGVSNPHDATRCVYQCQ